MAGLPPGDPQLVSMIVSHLKTQGLFDQFRRDCLADVDTKPAYLNLKQRVDNFVSNHLSNHTWSPHLNKNQLRNNIRQLVLQSGMLEQGVDRIVAQVVDPKINHLFRPQVERVVREFLSPGSCSEEPPLPPPSTEAKPDVSIPEQASSSAPATTSAGDAMSILDTITSLNQEASVRASSDRGRRGQDEPMQLVEDGEQDMSLDEEGDDYHDGRILEEAEELATEVQAFEVKTEDSQEHMDLGKDGLIEEVKMEEDESGAQELTEEERERAAGKTTGKPTEEKQEDDLLKCESQAKQKARERIKEEYFLEDSDLDGLSDITVSSVHTSDLSSFEEQSDDDELLSDSSEEGELQSDDQDEGAEQKQGSADAEEERKPRRKAYVHKPFLYSRYYSDSDDEITVEERRRSAAKDKEERLLKRQQNRERMEEKRKQKAAQAEEQDQKKQKGGDSAGLDGPRAKEARKERKVLEKKVALNRKRKLDSRKEGDVSSKKRGDAEGFKKAEGKSTGSKPPQPKLLRNLSESASSDERHRRMSGSVSEDSCETKKLSEKSRTHSFILELEQGSQEALKQRSVGKFDRLARKELHLKERKEKERSLSDERAKPTKQKQEKKSEHQADEAQQKEGAAAKVTSEEKGEKKLKIKSEKKMAATPREGKSSLSDGVADEGPKDAAIKKSKAPSVETVKAEKDKSREKEKDKDKSKEKAKGERTSAKSDFKQLLRPDSACSSEDRSDMEPGFDSSKKKDKHSKEVLKRSKSHTEDRPVDKPKSKTDNKDGEKEKTKADQDSQKSNKSSSEMDKDPKRAKPTDKGRIVEKSKSKSKEETKTLLLPKTDTKVQSSEVKSPGGAPISKPEKKKEGNAKEQRKASEEPLHEKSEPKSGKKKTEKKDKAPEKKDDDQEEKKTPREDKLEKSDKSSKSSVSSLDAEEQPKKRSLLQDASTDSDPVTTTVTTSFSDDTCDALSDITPEPPEGETESQLSDAPALPAEADALLALMDVCSSEEARLAPESSREEAVPEMTLHDVDMKMKEAALTLLSMDPDSTVSAALICHDARKDQEVNPTAALQTTETTAAEHAEPPMEVETTAAEHGEPPMEVETTETTAAEHGEPPMEMQIAAEAEFTSSEPSQQFVDEKPNAADVTEVSETEMIVATAEVSESPAPQEDDTTSNDCQALLNEAEAQCTAVASEAQPDVDTAPTAESAKEAGGAVVSEADEVRGTTYESTTAVASEIPERASEMTTEQEQTEPIVTDTETSPKPEEVEAEDNQAKMDIDDSEAESKTVEEENVATEKIDPQTVEHNVLPKTEEIRASGSESQSILVKQISNVSSADSQEDEKGSDRSEKEEKTAGRGRRKRKLSTQKVAVEECGDEKESKEQLSAEEKVVEVRTPRRGRSSKTSEEAEKDQPKEPEKLQEPSSCLGRVSEAAAKEATADNQKKAENQDNERQGVDLPSPVPEGSEAAGGSGETTDTRKPAMKRKRSEEMEESVEETKEETMEAEVEQKKDNSQQEPSVEQADSGDKKDKKAEESEQNDDDEDGEKEEEGKGTATRATTRAASRLEAERNRPSKPSTRASRQNGKEETAAGTRGTRGQAAAAAKGGRKREASPPAVRTRGGQKSEEPPSKRAKR